MRTPPAYRQRHEALIGRPPDDVQHRRAVIRGSGDVEKYEFIRPLVIVREGAFDRIAGIAQLEEFRALDDAAAGHVQAGDHAFGEHRVRSVTQDRSPGNGCSCYHRAWGPECPPPNS